MSRLLLYSAPASVIDQASPSSSPSSHHPQIPDLPIALPTRCSPPIRHPPSRHPREQPLTILHTTAAPQDTSPDKFDHQQSTENRDIRISELPQHQTPIASAKAGSHGSPTPLAHIPSRHHLSSPPPKCRIPTNRRAQCLLQKTARCRTSTIVAHLHTGLFLCDSRLPSRPRLLLCKS